MLRTISTINAPYLFATQLVEMGASLMLIPLLVRNLGIANYGFYVSVYALINVLATLGHLGTHRLLIRDIARFPRLGRLLVNQNVILKLILVPALTLGIFGALILMNRSPIYFACTLICAAEIALRLFGSSYNAVFRAQRRGLFELCITMADRSWSLMMSMLALQWLHDDVALIAVFTTFATAAVLRLLLSLAGATLLLNSSAESAFRPRLSVIRYTIINSRRIFASEGLRQVSDEFPLLVTNQTLSLSEVGQFGVALKALRFMFAIGTNITANWFPILSRSYLTLSFATFRALVRRYAIYMAAASLALLIATFLSAPTITLAVVGNPSDTTTLAIQILCLTVPALWINTYAQIVLQSCGQQDRQLMPVFIGTILGGIAIFLTAASHSLVGVCIAIVVGDYCELLLNYVVVRKSIERKFTS